MADVKRGRCGALCIFVIRATEFQADAKKNSANRQVLIKADDSTEVERGLRSVAEHRLTRSCKLVQSERLSFLGCLRLHRRPCTVVNMCEIYVRGTQ